MLLFLVIVGLGLAVLHAHAYYYRQSLAPCSDEAINFDMAMLASMDGLVTHETWDAVAGQCELDPMSAPQLDIL